MIVPATSPAEEPLVAAQRRLAALYEKLAKNPTNPYYLDELYEDIAVAELEVEKEKAKFAKFLESQPKSELDLALQEAVDILDGKIAVDQAPNLKRRANK